MEELEGSELGTLTHWEETYRRERREFDARGDPGEVWFGEDSVQRVVDWLVRCERVRPDTRIIDVGCGNGFSLLQLAREGFTDLTGVDYSPEAIALAQKVGKEFPNIVYKVFDVTDSDPSPLGRYGVVHDKGTYDAVSLHPETPRERRARYIDSVERLMNDDGLFVITSCNWTQEELVEQFSGHLRLSCAVPTPQFKFGGKVGSVVTTAVFTKWANRD